MSKKHIGLSLALLVFVLGWLCSTAYSEAALVSQTSKEVTSPSLIVSGSEQISPFDWISERDIYVYEDKVIIKINDARWATFTDTNSMDPVIDIGANAIEIVPQKESDIHVGDIVSYDSRFIDGSIIHRVVNIGYDEDGIFYTLQGDNNAVEDPEKVRFKQIRRVVVAIIY